jgi:uncharacterized membrane protein
MKEKLILFLQVIGFVLTIGLAALSLFLSYFTDYSMPIEVFIVWLPFAYYFAIHLPAQDKKWEDH